jgi:hypothetical protein
MAAQPRIKLALVGLGAELVQAVDAFNRPSAVEIVAVVDAQDRAEGARLAERLRIWWAGTSASTSACWRSNPPASR